MNGWMYLVIAGIAEVFYAASMLRTEGFTRIYPSIFCLTFIGVSMYFLSLATRTIPVGTAYAVWVGIGAAGAAILGIVLFHEPASPARLLFLGLLITAIIGLKATSGL